MKKIERILVPTDLSELSLAAMDYASSLAALYDAKLFLLHAVDIVPVVSFPTVDFTLETALHDEVESARMTLEHLISEKFGNLKNVSAIIRRGVAYDEIMKLVKEEQVDLVVMATHGRTGLPHIIMGSVAEKIVRHSPVPVLTVKPPKIHGEAWKSVELKQLELH